MAGAPYVHFYTSDFLAGTGGMTAATKGVYITLLCLMYETEAPLAQSWDMLARRCGCSLPAFKRAVLNLQNDGKIVAGDSGLWSWKCDKHIAQRRDRSSSAASSAKKRWQKSEGKQCESDANAMRTQCYPEPEPDIKIDTDVSIYRSDAPSTSEEPAEKQPVPKQSRRSTSDGFERFWAVYPRKVAKGAARKAWDRAAKLATEADIIAGAERYAAERAGQDHKFTAHAASWLNAERWADEATQPATGRNNDGSGMAIARRAADIWLAQQGRVDFGEDSNAVVPLFPDRRVIGGA